MYIESWNMYFPEEQYTVYNESIKMINELKDYIRTNTSSEEIIKTNNSCIYTIKYEEFEKLIDTYKQHKNASSLIDCISCAVSELFRELNLDSKKVTTRIINYQKMKVNKQITTDDLGVFIYLRGTICRVGFKKIVIQKAYFECKKCNEVVHTNIQNNIMKQPTKCVSSCKSKSFQFLYNHPQTIIRDMQEIKIQRFNSLSNNEEKDNLIVDCIVYDDYVGTLVPGDVISACGIITAENESNTLYKLIVNVNNLGHLNNKTFYVEDLDYEEQDFIEFRKIAKIKNIVQSFIHSLYPDIYGHELIKVGMLLSLFGGTRKYVGHCKVRSEIHTLIVGDPGLGKSRMLTNSCSILGKSTYVSGNLTTSAGLTVSIAHDPVSGDYMADAGALVVADNGICCIDEFDKIADHSSLFEAMEDQKVTVAKGGVICSVPTRSTILAAANPRYGHFNQSKSIRENLRFDNALLSRFDLIFILIDNLNEKENYEISEQILKRRHLSSSSTTSNFNKLLSDLKSDKFMKTLYRTDTTKIFPIETIKKYLSYARCSVFPVLSASAKDELKNFYLKIRKSDGTTIRDLESLIRITESRAKIELRSIASLDDALFSIELYKRLMEKGVKNTAKKGTVKDFINLISEKSAKNQTSNFSYEELLDMYKSVGINKSFTVILEQLNYKGILILKNNKLYQYIT